MTTTLDDLPLPVPTHFRNGVLYAFSADQLRAARREGYELAMRKAQEGREPAGVVFTMEALGALGSGPRCHVSLYEELPAGTKLYTSPPPKSDEPGGLFEVRIAGPDDVHSHNSELEALRHANGINLQYVADCLKHPDPSDHVMCVATVHKTGASIVNEPVVSLTGPERVWTCTVIGNAEDLPHGSDAPMRKAVFDAFSRQTGNAPAHIFSGWGNPVPERYRSVMENRLPDPEVIRKECLEVLNILPNSDEARDAERYRVLRDFDSGKTELAICRWSEHGWVGEWVIEHEPDAAIDAALSAQQKGNK